MPGWLDVGVVTHKDTEVFRDCIDRSEIVDGAMYLHRQSVCLDALFDHTDNGTIRTYGIRAYSTLRLKEPQEVGAMAGDPIRYLNWVTPQQLSCQSWSWWLGFAAPSFTLDRFGRGALRGAYFTTSWQNVGDSFVAGGLMHRDDEIWCSVLTSNYGTRWDLQTVKIDDFGIMAEAYVGGLVLFARSDLTPLQCRLHLPSKTRLGSVLVPSANAGDIGIPTVTGLPSNLYAQRVPMTSEGVYAVNGAYTPGVIMLNGVANGTLIDLSEAAFASGGLSFRPVDRNEMKPGKRTTTTVQGQAAAR
jgi:hypothetical protein